MFLLNDNDVLIVSCKNYKEDTVDKAYETIFSYFKRETFQGKNVYIKPNILNGSPKENATTTHPAIVYPLAKYLVDANADVLCGDSPNFVTIESMINSIYKVTGIAEAIQKAGAKTDTDVKSVKTQGGKYLPSFKMLKTIADSDIVINYAKAKTHSFTGFTGCVKNLFGVIPGPVKGEMHFRYATTKKFVGAMMDICNGVKADLHMVDAVIGMEGPGPSGGDPKTLGAIVVGKNPYAVDEVVVELMKLQKDKIPQIALARKEGLTKPVEELNIIGTSIKDIQSGSSQFRAAVHTTSFSQIALRYLLPEKLFNKVKSKPIIQDNCVKCGICQEACPPKAITIGEDKAMINYSDCIKCYCCQELCPARAITIGKKKE